MRILKFHKTECGVDFLLNVLTSEQVKENYINSGAYNTDFFEIIFFKKGNGALLLNQEKITISDNQILFISPFQKRQWVLEADHLDFTVLAFQEDFLNDFSPTNYSLFVYSISTSYLIPYIFQKQRKALQNSANC